MVVRTARVASPRWARRNDADRYTNALRHYPNTIHELATRRSWRRLFRKAVVPDGSVAELAGLSPRGPIYHHRDRDHLLVLTPVDGVSPALIDANPTGRVYYGSPRLSVVLEEDPNRPHDALDLGDNELSVREGMAQFRPIARREPFERDTEGTPAGKPARDGG